MESARLKINKNVFVYEDELPLLFKIGKLDKDSFVCSGCLSKAIPCSFKPDNLRRPHFKVESHEENCDIFKYKQLLKVAKKQKITTASGFPLSYPSKLYLQDIDKRIVEKNNKEGITTGVPKNITSYQNDGIKTTLNEKHHRTSSTIRPIVKHFIEFPYDRSLSLQVPMLDSNLNTYNKVFKKINKYKIDDKVFFENYQNLKLYYVQLSVSDNNIELKGNTLSLKLLIDFNDNYTLDINVENWSERKKSEVINELLDLTEEKKELYSNAIKKIMKKENKSYKDITDEDRKKIKIKENLFIFFVGFFDEDNKHSFKLYKDDYRLYYARLANIFYPKFA